MSLRKDYCVRLLEGVKKKSFLESGNDFVVSRENYLCMRRVLVVGSAKQSGGGVSSVIKLMTKMPVWSEYQCYWLGTQIQASNWVKFWYALKSYFIAVYKIWSYDIVHFHTTPDKGGLLVQFPIMILSLLTKKKIIIHVHMGNQLKYHTNNIFFIWYLRHADIIVLLAKKWKESFCELFPKVNKRIQVIYNACEALPDVSLEKKDRIIVLMAHMIEDKGIDVMLKAWQLLYRDYKDWHVYMMGGGDYVKYKELSEEMGLQDSMTFTGYIRGEEKEVLLQSASISVMCSYNEGFPMVVLEGWAYEHAVVTTPVGGLPDVIEDGRNCLVFDFGDYEMLADQLKRLMDDDGLRITIAKYSKKYGEQMFSLQEISSSISQLYDSL